MIFKDFNFKLAVIQELMYNQELITPVFDIYDFTEKYQERKINIENEGFHIIPEARKYFEDLAIPEDLLPEIEELSQDGGDEIYLQLCPFWDGEDDLFNIHSPEDCNLLPNLKKITLFYDKNEIIIEKFKKKGVSAEFL